MLVCVVGIIDCSGVYDGVLIYCSGLGIALIFNKFLDLGGDFADFGLDSADSGDVFADFKLDFADSCMNSADFLIHFAKPILLPIVK